MGSWLRFEGGPLDIRDDLGIRAHLVYAPVACPYRNNHADDKEYEYREPHRFGEASGNKGKKNLERSACQHYKAPLFVVLYCNEDVKSDNGDYGAAYVCKQDEQERHKGKLCE